LLSDAHWDAALTSARSVVDGLSVDPFSRQMLSKTYKELEEECSVASIQCVVDGLSVDPFSRQMLSKTYKELEEEWRLALQYVTQ
jgi:hypothetical protein